MAFFNSHRDVRRTLLSWLHHLENMSIHAEQDRLKECSKLFLGTPHRDSIRSRLVRWNTTQRQSSDLGLLMEHYTEIRLDIGLFVGASHRDSIRSWLVFETLHRDSFRYWPYFGASHRARNRSWSVYWSIIEIAFVETSS